MKQLQSVFFFLTAQTPKKCSGSSTSVSDILFASATGRKKKKKKKKWGFFPLGVSLEHVCVFKPCLKKCLGAAICVQAAPVITHKIPKF